MLMKLTPERGKTLLYSSNSQLNCLAKQAQMLRSLFPHSLSHFLLDVSKNMVLYQSDFLRLNSIILYYYLRSH